jgi:hypothetical protein
MSSSILGLFVLRRSQDVVGGWELQSLLSLDSEAAQFPCHYFPLAKTTGKISPDMKSGELDSTI